GRGFNEGLLRHRANHQRANCASCSSGSKTSSCSSRADCPGSSHCSDWSNALKSLLVRQAAILAAVALLPAACEGIYFRDKISWRFAIAPSEMVTVEQACEWGDTAIWVDARPDDEFANDHVPGAISLNEDRWNELLPQSLAAWSPGKKIIVYCSSLS